MAFQKPVAPVQFADLKSMLSQSRQIDPALFQTIQILIERLDQLNGGTGEGITNITNTTVNPSNPNTSIDATYLTTANEVAKFPSSVRLIAGSNINFADVANQRTINATGGGADLDYLGDYVTPKTYNDGDIVVASDGIAYMCVVDGTTTPPEPWPGGGVLPHHITHEPGGTDAIVGAAWLNLANVFTKFQTILDAIPELRFINRDQPANARIFRIFENVGILNFQSVDDAVSVQQGAVQINRQGVLIASGLGSTPLDASNATSGTLPDARLSSNVALRTIDNFWATAETFLSWITINGNPSYFYLYNPAGGINRKNWRHVNYGDGTFRIELTDDAINTVLADFEINNLGGIQKFGGQINFPAAQLASSNPNSLDDYEEGDWGTIDVSGAGLGFAANAKYIKIGRHVTITLGMQFPGNSNSAGAKIGGLPFASQTVPPGGVLSGGFNSVPASYYIREGQAYFEMFGLTTGAPITNAQLSGAYIYVTGTYLAQS